MRLGKLLGEEDQFGSVLLQTLNVLLKRLDALVTATVVDGNANGPRSVWVTVVMANWHTKQCLP